MTPISRSKDPKYIIVSNRLPVTVQNKNGNLTITPSSGGLASAMSSINLKKHGALWIGWPGISSDKLSEEEKQTVIKKLKEFNCFPIFLNSRQVKNYYGGYCNDTLWPLFHYFQTHVKNSNEYWRAYNEVNRLYRDTVMEIAKLNSTIWVHDYHLFLLPALLRKELPAATIGFFLHIPFPSYEIFRMLPNREQILRGIMGADLIGFHIYDYARHFLRSLLRITGIESERGVVDYQNRLIKVDSFPIGIDVKKFRAALKDSKTKKEIRLISKSYSKLKIILSVDRLDYSKGMLQRLEAFELLLREEPKLRTKVSLIMVTVPSRVDVQEYRFLKNRIEQMVGRINGKYGTSHWTPIAYQFTELSFENIVSLYAKADVALVTPLRDGMNLVAKEYVAVKNKQEGVLILSEMAGAVDELQEAIHVNPNNVKAIKAALSKALSMPKKEQQLRLRAMAQRLNEYNVEDWVDDFLEQLTTVKQMQKQQNAKLLDAKGKEQIKKSFVKAKKRLIILDYDGTIQKFFKSPDPKVAKPSKELRSLVGKLSKQENTNLSIVSGRPKSALESWFGKMKIDLAAEHGAHIKTDGKWKNTDYPFKRYKKVILPILKRYTRRTVGSTIEEKDFALVWHYRNVPPELAYIRSLDLRRELHNELEESGIHVHSGNKIVEIKPAEINKGKVVRQLLAKEDFDFIICIGDDYTDEDMFQALPKKAYSLKVGLGKTNAEWRLPAIDDVLALLESLTETAE